MTSVPDQLDPHSPIEERGYESRPRLRLHHLFVFTAVAAVFLAIAGPQQDYWARNPEFAPPEPIQYFFMAWGLLYTFVTAIAVTGLAYGIYWNRQGLAFFDQPGHWLLVEIGVIGLLGLVPALVMRWIFGMPQFDGSNFNAAIGIIFGIYSLLMLVALPIALNVYIGLKKCRESHWSAVFYVKAAAKIMFGIGDIAILPVLYVAVMRDGRANIPRDSGHWCGVWVQVANSIMTIGTIVLSIVNVIYVFSRMP